MDNISFFRDTDGGSKNGVIRDYFFNASDLTVSPLFWYPDLSVVP